MHTEKWIQRWLQQAKQVASWSKDPGTKVGAIAVDDDGVVLSQGFNGFPRGIDDSPERLNDRSFKLDHVVHAELNCILNAARTRNSLLGSSMFVFGLPVCHRCAPCVIQAGIKDVYMLVPEIIKRDWAESWSKSHAMFQEVGVGTYVYPEVK